jgi:hypothetical protein
MVALGEFGDTGGEHGARISLHDHQPSCWSVCSSSGKLQCPMRARHMSQGHGDRQEKLRHVEKNYDESGASPSFEDLRG